MKRYKYSDEFDFGAIIAEARKEKELTLGELAGMTGLSLSTLSRYERGKRTPSLERFNTILKALGVEIVILERSRRNAE